MVSKSACQARILQYINRRHIDIPGRDFLDIELTEHLLSVDEFKDIESCFVVELFPDAAIEVRNGEVNVVLGKRVEAGTFRKQFSEVEMIVFDMRLFP